jgi:DNA (cytosine-5)-methyltransferase 1
VFDDMTLIDLFCGCGGFSLGAHQAGFDVAAAFDNDDTLSASYAHNFPDTTLVLADIATLKADRIRRIVGRPIEGIFGGPPCQGFSDIGKRLPSDPRRQLLGHFFRLVAELKPAFFVMENVRGLTYSDARGVLDAALKLVRKEYDILEPRIFDAAEFGAATKRARLFVIGVHKDRGDPVDAADVLSFRRPAATVRAAISDLQGARGIGDFEGFDVWKIARAGRPYAYARHLRSTDGLFTGQRSTAHSPAVVSRFAALVPGTYDQVGRHPKLEWDGQSPTLRAGTGADRGSFQSVRPIHPEEARVITVREAARLQGFPDAHRFHPTIWHSFRMIGNSVSPIMAKAIFEAVALRVGNSLPLAIAAE